MPRPDYVDANERRARPPGVVGPRGAGPLARRLVGSSALRFSPFLDDLVNDAGIYQWRLLPLDIVRQEVMAAARDIDSLVASVPDDIAAKMLASGRRRWLYRADHRNEHLDQLK